ncbi:PREDICTED: protein ERGIC-53-like [Condylura cristata]|uniref:protein ERGIC-53-like n=1 Tax=Condylura cristata TaxID=143302 RepID=UPI000643211B|nr:PREDICTED: protein ERGIC-53-like [Condylura cristata]
MPPVVSGADRLLCLLLLLLAPHNSEGDHPPQRRFEYKFSFKGPRLALPGAGIPFWSHHGDAIPGLEEVRLAPSLRNQSGAVWSRAPVPFSAWEVKVQMRVTGPGRQGARGMVVWYTRDRGQLNFGLGALASWDGIGILFDSSAENTLNSPAVRVLASDGHTPTQSLGNEASQVLGSCHQNFRNRPYPFRTRITYWGQRLLVFLSSGLTPNDPEELCVDVGPVILAPGGFFGISAATSTLADDHDVLSFLTFSLSEPAPEVFPQPSLEKEQLRLAGQLEVLRARLALGSKEDMIPKLHSEALEEGERVFDLEETLGRHSQTLQALHAISEQLVQAERKWKQQLGSSGQIRPGEAWVSHPSASKSPSAVLARQAPWALSLLAAVGPLCAERGTSKHHTWELVSPRLNRTWQTEEQARGALCKQTLQERRQVCRRYNRPGANSQVLHDSSKVSALLHAQQTLLQDLQEMRDAAAHMASRAQVFYLPVGTKHHFLELTQILSHLQKELRGPVKAAAKNPRPPGRLPGASSCLQPGIFVLCLLIQTAALFCYVHLRQDLDVSLRDYLSMCRLPLSSTPQIPRALGALRRQPHSSSLHA